MSKFQWTAGILGMMVVLAFFIVVAMESCAPVPPDVYVDKDNTNSISTVKRHVDEEYGVVCYIARYGISCVPIPEQTDFD